MPEPTLPIKIAVKTSLLVGESVKIINRTQEEIIRASVAAGGQVIVNPANYGYTWANDDSIVCEISGRRVGNGTGTITKSTLTVTITDTVDTSSPAVSL